MDVIRYKPNDESNNVWMKGHLLAYKFKFAKFGKLYGIVYHSSRKGSNDYFINRIKILIWGDSNIFFYVCFLALFAFFSPLPSFISFEQTFQIDMNLKHNIHWRQQDGTISWEDKHFFSLPPHLSSIQYREDLWKEKVVFDVFSFDCFSQFT